MNNNNYIFQLNQYFSVFLDGLIRGFRGLLGLLITVWHGGFEWILSFLCNCYSIKKDSPKVFIFPLGDIKHDI